MHKTKKDDGNPVGSITWEIKKNSAVEASTSSEAEKIFQGENESLAPNWVTIITCGLVVRKWLIRFFITAGESYLNISFSSLFFFCCSSRSESSKLSGSPSWIFLWSRNDRRVPTFYIWCTVTPNVCAQSLIFCLCYGAIGTGDRIWILVWPTGSWHVCVQDTKTLDL